MGDMSKEPSMEEILSSIRRVMAREDAESDKAPRIKTRVIADPFAAQEAIETAEASDEEVLELTDTTADSQPDETPADATRVEDDPLLSKDRVEASRNTLSQLAEIVKPQPGADLPIGTVSLDDMVREAIKPMLKQWLDQNLPTIVEDMVAREIQRISGRVY